MSAINNITIEKNIEKSHDMFIIGVNENHKRPMLTSTLSNETKKSLNSIFSLESDIGKNKKKSISYNNLESDRICLYGYPNPSDNDEIRSIAATLTKFANKSKCKSVSVDIKSFGLGTDSKLQSFVEGLVLGSYEFNDYKSKSNDTNLVNDEET